MKNRIKELREALGLSQQQLAEKSGLTAPTISRLERDTREMSRTTRRALAQALVVSESGLFDDGDAPERRTSAVLQGERDGPQPLLILCRTVEQLIQVEEYDLAAGAATKLADRCRVQALASKSAEHSGPGRSR